MSKMVPLPWIAPATKLTVPGTRGCSADTRIARLRSRRRAFAPGFSSFSLIDDSRREQPRVALAQRLAPSALEHVAVRDHHPIELPGQDALEAPACERAVADQQR